MGMPISLALRGRHTDDAAARGAWAEAVAALRDVDRVFSTYRPDSFVSRLGRGELTARRLPARGGRGARARGAGPAAVARRLRRTPAAAVLDPSGVVKGWAVERAARPLRALPDTDVCLSAGGDLVCQVAGPDSPDWRIGIEDPHDPTRVVAVVPVRTGAVATSGLAHRGGHVVDARTGAVPDGDRLGHRRPRRPGLGRHRRHRRLRPGPRRRPLAAHPRPAHRPGRLGRRPHRGGGVARVSGRRSSTMPTRPGRKPTASHGDAIGFWWISRPTPTATTPNRPPMTHRPNRETVALSSRKKARDHQPHGQVQDRHHRQRRHHPALHLGERVVVDLPHRVRGVHEVPRASDGGRFGHPSIVLLRRRGTPIPTDVSSVMTAGAGQCETRAHDRRGAGESTAE